MAERLKGRIFAIAILGGLIVVYNFGLWPLGLVYDPQRYQQGIPIDSSGPAPTQSQSKFRLFVQALPWVSPL